MTRSALRVDINGNAWSYATQIIAALPDGTRLGNATKYSRTTSKHQSIVGVQNCDIVVNDVPEGVSNLSGYLLDRPHLIDELELMREHREGKR